MAGKVNIKQLFRKFFSRWYYFVVALALTLALAFAYTAMAPKQYYVKASLLLKNENPAEIDNVKLPGGATAYRSQTRVEDEIGVLKSYSMVERAIRELDFGIAYFASKNLATEEKYHDASFTVEIDSVINQVVGVPIYIELVSSTRYKVKVSGKNLNVYNFYTHEIENKIDQLEIDEEVPLNKPFVHKYLSFNIKFNDVNKPNTETKTFFRLERIKTITEEYQRKLRIEPISPESFIVELGVKGRMASKEKAFLNKLLEVYLKNELYKKNQLGLRTIQFIDNQLSGASDTLLQMEGALQLFKPGNRVLDINATTEDLTKNLARLEASRVDLENKLKYYTFITNSLNDDKRLAAIIAPSSVGIGDEALNNLLLELSKLTHERTTPNYNTRENAPLAEIVEQKIKDTKKSLGENIKGKIETSSNALTNLNNRIFLIKKNLTVIPKNNNTEVNVKRRFDFNDEVYNYLLERRAEAGIAIASNAIEKTVVDVPYQVGDGPVSPDTLLIFLAAVVVGIGAAIGLIVLRDVLNDNIITVEDVEQNTKIPFIGTISHANKREQGSIIAHATSPIGESFRSLRVNLQYLTLGKNANVIGITSSRESEGKTFCSVNLAAVMAYAGRRTILIDTDMRRPRVAEYFQLENRKGLSNFLVGDGSSIKEIINNTEHKGFDVIGSGPIPPNPIDLIGNPRMEELIETLKQTYSTIILDSPPLGYVSEYIILMKYTDANLYIIRSDYTNRTSLTKINKLYERKKISNFNILLNDVKATKHTGYGYGYGYGYKF